MRLLDGYSLLPLHDIAEGRERVAIERIHASFCTARLAEGRPSVIECFAWGVAMSCALFDLRTSLSHLPPGLDLRAIEDAVLAADPRGSALRALAGDRTVANRIFDQFHGLADQEMREMLGVSSLLSQAYCAIWLPFDQARYLHTLEDAISFAKEPYWKVAPRLESWWEGRGEHAARLPISAMLTPMVPELIEQSARLEAMLLIARVALLAYREGIEDAIDLASTTTDPFSGRPLRTRVDPDGALLIWAIGPDGEDDGGALHPKEDEGWYEPPDITWKIRLR